MIGEIRDALERSAKALQDAAGRSPEAQPTLLLHAKTHLHQAHGALQMVDVEGVDRLTGAAEKALDRFKDGSLARRRAEHAAVVGEAYQALVEYLEELLAARSAASSRCACSRTTARCRNCWARSACIRARCWCWIRRAALPLPAGG